MSDQPKSTGEWTAETLACFFHDTYEMLAPSFGYETREDTREFNPESKNGRLMVTVCGAVLLRFNAALAAEREKSVADFASKILHGDEVHKAWLIEAADAYINGLDLPSPRSSPIIDEAVNEAWSELEAELDIGYITNGKTYECGQCRSGKGKSPKDVKHDEGCIVPSWEKASELNRKMFQQLDAELAKAKSYPLLGGASSETR